ncbi:MAG: hypothetical protein JNM25_17195 [Planctomycetes bacterium]|nr:hypothetical protein [Planctomycetota bacterium]
MVAIALTRSAVLLAASFFAGCASDPGLPRAVTIEDGRPVRVQLQRLRERQTFLLQNASSADTAAFYRDASPLAKVVPDRQLQALLDVLAAKGMFAAATDAVPPDARDVLVVDATDHRWTWARRRSATPAEIAAFQEALAYFLEVYNSSTAYHPSDRVPDLEAERDRVRQQAEAARLRLERLQGEQP